MRRRYAVAAVSLLLFSCLAMVASYNIHQLLSRQYSFSYRMLVCFRALGNPTVRSWFLLLEASTLLAMIWLMFGRKHISYNNKMIHVCQRIYTPAPDGHGEYGTACWLKELEKSRAFTAVHIDRRSLQELIAHGRDDLEGCL